MGAMINSYNILVKSLKEQDHLENPTTDRRVIF
jgi:hypothetical protein